jgi:hypothetical protein
MRTLRDKWHRATCRQAKCYHSPWTQAQAEEHARVTAHFHALLSRDGGFKENRAEHRAAMAEVGRATVSLDWDFFARSRQIRGA